MWLIQRNENRDEMLKWFIELNEANLRYNRWTFVLLMVGSLMFLAITAVALYLGHRLREVMKESASASKESASAAKESADVARMYMGRVGSNTQEAKDKVERVAETVQALDKKVEKVVEQVKHDGDKQQSAKPI